MARCLDAGRSAAHSGGGIGWGNNRGTQTGNSALLIGYEYNELLEPASKVEPKGADENDGGEDVEEAENDEDEDESNDGSDTEPYNSGNEDVQTEGDEDEGMSWQSGSYVASGRAQRKPNPYLATSTQCNDHGTTHGTPTDRYFIQLYTLAASDTLTFTKKHIKIA
ncbi:hypothetical protein FRC10_007884 [Ceratobasidium sp. 414]|nr:hypothetical protein FRC10_007884 [Ceratobasidium sp. 414]